MEIFKAFADPYLKFILGAAYSVQQMLEGLGLWTSTFFVRNKAGQVVNSYWSTTEAVAFPFFGLLVYSVVLVLLALWSIKSLTGKKGLYLGLVITCMPGTLSLAGLWPSLDWVPEHYLIGTGDLGSPWGMFAVLAMSLLTGWTVIVLLTHFCRLGDRFRHAYDHAWYSMAIVTGLLFVADMDASRTTREMQEANRISQGASAYLLQQVRRLALACDLKTISAPSACHWANRVQGTLENYAYYGDRLYWQFGPATSTEIYTPFSRNRDEAALHAIRLELADYNQRECPERELGPRVTQMSPVSSRCQSPPPVYCTALPEPFSGQSHKFAMATIVAIASECVVPTLIVQRARQEKLAKKVATGEVSRHLRWLFFTLVAALAGGKVANASARLTSLARCMPVSTMEIVETVETLPEDPVNVVETSILSRKRRSWILTTARKKRTWKKRRHCLKPRNQYNYNSN